jgi:hypothetical protein
MPLSLLSCFGLFGLYFVLGSSRSSRSKDWVCITYQNGCLLMVEVGASHYFKLQVPIPYPAPELNPMLVSIEVQDDRWRCCVKLDCGARVCKVSDVCLQLRRHSSVNASNICIRVFCSYCLMRPLMKLVKLNGLSSPCTAVPILIFTFLLYRWSMPKTGRASLSVYMI